MEKYINAEKLTANLVTHIVNPLQQSQPKVDLDNEISKFIRTYFTKPGYDKDFIAEADWEKSMRECAHHFYELTKW